MRRKLLTLILASFAIGVFAQVPQNDEPCNATLLTVNSSCTYATYNSTNATQSFSVPQPTGSNCAGWGGGRDVWFRVTVPLNGAVTISTNQSVITDAVMAAYRGPNCNNLTLIECDDDDGPGLMPQISLIGETPGSTLWFRIWRYNSNTGGLFQICASNAIPNTQDCLGAIPLCQATYSTANSYSGTGNIPNEINTSTSCLSTGERNSVWYTFSVQTSGTLNFTITPNVSSNDYDWSVYNLTTASCSDIANNASLEVSCNWSSTTGATGINSTGTSNSQGVSGTTFNAPLNVTAGQTYVVHVSNFSTTGQSGYNINFSNSTATILDNVSPRLRSLDTLPACGQNRVVFSLNENVMCNSVQATDFTLTGPGGNYPITQIRSIYCQLGTTYDNAFTVYSSTPFTQAGTYTLCLTGSLSDICGNQSQANSSCLTFNISELTATATGTNIICKGQSTGTASVTASGAGGASSYTYLWSNNATTASISGLAAGTYTVTVTSGQCTKTASVTITEPALGITATAANTPANCGQADGSATVTPANGTPNYTYVWSNSQTTQTANNLSAGNYSVTVRDANNCTAVFSTVVPNQNSTLAITVRGDTACSVQGQGRAFVTATGGSPTYTYLWSNNATTDTITNLPNGAYSVTVRDANNCSVTASTGVLRYPAITFNAPAITTANCGQSDGSATVNPTNGGGGFTYLWSNNQITQTATLLAAGNYSVTVNDANNCTATTAVTVPNQASSLAITLKGDTACDGPSATKIFVTATGGTPNYTYLWSNNQTTDSVKGIANGVYSVTVRDAVNCSVTGTTGVLRYAPITFNAPQITNATCGQPNGTATVNPTGGGGSFTYLWNNTQYAQTATGLAAGNYSVTVTDVNQCTGATSLSITQLGSPTISAINKTDVSCFGGANGTATVTPSGNLSYLWSNNQVGATATGLAAGTYTVTASDASNCTVSGSVTISQPDSLKLDSAQILNANCFGSSSGRIAVYVSGGSGALNYTWSNTQSGAVVSALSAGNYTVTVTDANSCTLTRGFTIAEPTDLVLQITPVNVVCKGDSSGEATVAATGSNGNYTYIWSNGQSVATATNLKAGSYTVTVTSGQCTKVANTTINEPLQAVSVSTSSTLANCGQSDGTATATASNGVGSYTYLWSDNQTAQTAVGLAPGNFSVTVRDANSCSATATVLVQNQSSGLAAIATADTACGNVGQGEIFVTVSGGTLPYTYLWSNSQVSDTIRNLANGAYSVTVTDGLNCSVVASTGVLRYSDITFNPSQTTSAYCGQNNGTATVNPAGGSGSFTYLWSTGASTQTITALGAGVYDVTVTDANFCTAQSLITVLQDGGPTITDTAHTDVSCYGGNDGTARVLAAGGAGNITYLWSNGQTSTTVIDLIAGNYIVTATDGNGCIATAIFTVGEPSAIVYVSSVIDSVSCFGGSDGGVSVSFAGGKGNLNYVWSNNQSGIASGGLMAGSYSVTVSDANSCSTTGSFVIPEPQAININVTTVDALCFGQASGVATAVATGGTPPYSYSWSAVNGAGATVSQLIAGAYTVTVNDSKYCTATQTFTVGQASLLNVSSVATPVSCQNVQDGVITPMAQGGTSPYTYQLSNGSYQETSYTDFRNLATGEYNLLVLDANGCTASMIDTIDAAVDEIFNVEADSTTCFGDVYKDGRITVSAVLGNGVYSYSLDGVNYRNPGVFDNLAKGTYDVYIRSNSGCEFTAIGTVYEPQKLVATVSPDSVIIPLGGSGTAEVFTNSRYSVTYEWSPAIGLSCVDCASPVVAPYVSTEYTLLVKDSRDGKKFCTATTKLPVEVGPHGEVLVPNLFSPNGDGYNDVFKVYANSVQQIDLKIFNRWGEKVFETNNIDNGWDGTYRGEMQMPDIFTYTVSIVFLNNQSEFKNGTITLVR